jgi:hypothetical protein
MASLDTSVKYPTPVSPHPKLRALPIKDLVCLLYQVEACRLPLRWRAAGVPDADVLRAEIRAREFVAEAGR